MPITPAISPTGQPVMPNMTELIGQGAPSDENSGEALKSKLDDMFASVEEEYRKMNTNKFSSNNKMERDRIDALRQVLDALQQSGIDLNDPEQIRAFMDQLAQQDPDLLALFEDAMKGLLGEESLNLGNVQEGQAPEGAATDMNPLGMPGGSLDVSQLSGMSPQGAQEMQGPPVSPASRFPNLMG